jgi:hypothetical protein
MWCRTIFKIKVSESSNSIHCISEICKPYPKQLQPLNHEPKLRYDKKKYQKKLNTSWGQTLMKLFLNINFLKRSLPVWSRSSRDPVQFWMRFPFPLPVKKFKFKAVLRSRNCNATQLRLGCSILNTDTKWDLTIYFYENSSYTQDSDK